MKTPIIDNSSVFEEQVAVQTFEIVDEGEKELFYCNHANTLMIEVEDLYGNTDEAELCAKPNCKAYRPLGDSQWHDAPVGGKHESL